MKTAPTERSSQGSSSQGAFSLICGGMGSRLLLALLLVVGLSLATVLAVA